MSISSKILPNLGIEIKNLDVTSLTIQEINFLIKSYNQYHLLVIKNQTLSEEQLIKIIQIFGKAVPALVPTYRLENYPLITKHTNIKNKNKPTGVIAPEYVYHSDSYFLANPSKATLLYSLKSPLCGGETHFINMCAVYESLDESVKRLISDKKASYKNAYVNQPPVRHPLVRVHAVTKKKALFVNIHRGLGIDMMEQKEGLELLSYLYSYAIKSDFIYRHKWSNGDLLIWHNPTTMHCATGIEDTEERLLYRILTEGELPVT